MRLSSLIFALLFAFAQLGCAHRPAAPYPTAVVAADHHVASSAGAEILAKGGNAVDAAVATSFALSVVRPYSCGIGGGGFMIIRFKDDPKFGTRSIALNYRETAPAAVGADYYAPLDPDASRFGATAVGVPGTVAGLLYALEHYGTLDRATVLAPAIRAAEDGFVLEQIDIDYVNEALERYRKNPAYQTRFPFVWERFFRAGEFKSGDVVRFPEQAAALRLIARDGARAFYEGEIAEAIVSTIRADGGAMTMDDLRNYRVKEVSPLQFDALGHTFVTMAPPSSGGVAMAESLKIMSFSGTGFQPVRGAQADQNPQPGLETRATDMHILVEAWKNAFADRSRWLGDPDFVDVPVARLTSDEYARSLATKIDPDHTLPIESYGSIPPDDHGTSHLCVVDAHGNAVACTETINLVFGSKLAVSKFGFVLNDEMDDFTTRRGEANAFGLRQSERNAPAPGKRPLSSMTPTIVLDRNGDVKLIAGASGGPRIITGTMQAVTNVLVEGMDAPGAVASPRLHHQWMPDVLYVERKLYNDPDAATLIEELKRRGHRVEPAGMVGVVQLIVRVPGGYDAASDPRKGGRPAGF